MFSTDFIFRQQENFVDNQKCQAGFRSLCNKILFILFTCVFSESIFKFRIHRNPSMGVTSGEPTKPMEGNLSTVRISELQLKSSPLHPLKVMQSAWAFSEPRLKSLSCCNFYAPHSKYFSSSIKL